MKLKSSLIEDAQIEMHARLLRCPTGDNPKECPLHEVRKWPLEDRLRWLNNKSDEEIIGLYRHHIDCFESKLQLLAPETD
jgi:hypothetical protein